MGIASLSSPVTRDANAGQLTSAILRDRILLTGVRLLVNERRVRLDSTLHADEALGWDPLHVLFDIKRINHQEAYSHDGACTNQAESFFLRIWRAEIGQHHHIAGPYLDEYAKEMAWREDTRRLSNGEQFLLATYATLTSASSDNWQRYWQRSR